MREFFVCLTVGLFAFAACSKKDTKPPITLTDTAGNVYLAEYAYGEVYYSLKMSQPAVSSNRLWLNFTYWTNAVLESKEVLSAEQKSNVIRAIQMSWDSNSYNVLWWESGDETNRVFRRLQ